MGADAEEDACQHEEHGGDFEELREALFPGETIKQGKEGFEQHHGADEGERQQAADAVPQGVGDEGREKGDRYTDEEEIQPQAGVGRQGRVIERDGHERKALKAGDEADDEVPVLG